MKVLTVTLNPSIDETFSVARVVPDRKLDADDPREYPGGGGINVARVIARLGGDAQALWSSGGERGRRLSRLLDAEKLPHVAVQVDGEIRENLIALDRSTGEQYRFDLPGPQLSEADRERWGQALTRIPTSVEYVVFSGSLPETTPPAWYARLISEVPSSTKIVVDTKRAALRAAIERGVYLIKPNLRELEDLAGRRLVHDQDVERAAHEVVERRGAQAVVVSLGRGGAMLVTADRIERFSAPTVPVRSRVGAGDSMVGGIVTALIDRCSLDDAVRFGVAAGASAVMNEGTELCGREDVERLYQNVRRQEVPS